MKNATQTAAWIAEHININKEATLPSIQAFLTKKGDTTSLKGINAALELLEQRKLISRLGMRSFTITMEGKKACRDGTLAALIG